MERGADRCQTVAAHSSRQGIKSPENMTLGPTFGSAFGSALTYGFDFKGCIMNSELTGLVVVGVDESEQAILTVTVAAAAAQQMGCGLRVVHCLPDVVPMAPSLASSSSARFDEIAQQIVSAARSVALEVTDGELDIETVIQTGSRVHTLLDASEDARLIVLGHHGHTKIRPFMSASICAEVATRAHCPVLSVPANWSPEVQHRRVVVGVDDAAHSYAALANGFESAALREARLTILHTWKLRSPYDAIVGNMDDEMWQRDVTAQVETVIAGLREIYPEVVVDIDVRHQDPTEALLQASTAIDLLVLGRRGHGAPLGFHLGAVARTLIGEAECPVQITPLQRSESESDADDALLVDKLSPQF